MNHYQYVLSDYIHYTMAQRLHSSRIVSVLDIGGTGKLKRFFPNTVNANKKKGIDGCHLPYPDKSFDASVSIATLEHVADKESFLVEAFRVCKVVSLHWFPCGKGGEIAETFKRSRHFFHPCTVPSEKEIVAIVKKIKASWKLIPFVSLSEHLLTLTDLKPSIAVDSMFKLLHDNPDVYYGVLLELRRS